VSETASERNPSSQAGGAVIMEDRSCVNCGYNLRGLPMNGPCPECGTPIRPKKHGRYADNLTDAPMWYLRTVAVGLGLMSAGIFLPLLWLLFALLSPLRLAGVGVSIASAGVMITAGLCWIVGAIIATAKRATQDRTAPDWLLDSPAIRSGARFGQLVPLVASALAIPVASLGGTLGLLLDSTLSWLTLVAMAPLCVYVSGLADWAGDTGAASRLRASGWCMTVCSTIGFLCTLLLQVPGFPVPFLAVVVRVLAVLAILLGVVMMVAGIVQTSLTAAWAIQNSSASYARELRLAEKRRREEEQQASRAAAAPVPTPAQASLYDDSDEPVPLAGDDEPPPPDNGQARDPSEGTPAQGPLPRGHHVIERSGEDYEPYAIEDDEDQR